MFYRVQGQSMEPYAKEGDFVLANPFAFLFLTPKRGDVILVYHPKEQRLLIKRVMSVKEENKQKYVWVEGDNTSQSTDSRAFGWVSLKLIAGKPLCVV